MDEYKLPEELVDEAVGLHEQERKEQNKSDAPKGDPSMIKRFPNYMSLEELAARYNPILEAHVPGEALWGSPVLQNYIHDQLRKNRFTDKAEVARLAAHISVTYDCLLAYLNSMYPYRGRMLLTEDMIIKISNI